MSLSSNVQLRISTQLLREMTNQGDPTATTINTARLDAAVADVEGIFCVEVGIVYNDADQAHVSVAVDGVLSRLHEYTGITGRNTTEVRQRWERGLIRLAATLGTEQRLLPGSTSVLEESTETNQARPDADRGRWRDFVPNAVGAENVEGDL